MWTVRLSVRPIVSELQAKRGKEENRKQIQR